MPYSKSAESYLSMIGTGRVSISAAADLCRAIVEDVGSQAPQAVRALASLGAWGDHCQNQERDLHRWTCGLYGLALQPYDIEMRLQVSWSCRSVWDLPFQDLLAFVSPPEVPNEPGTSLMKIPFLLPHEICHALYAAGISQATPLKLCYTIRIYPHYSRGVVSLPVQQVYDWGAF